MAGTCCRKIYGRSIVPVSACTIASPAVASAIVAANTATAAGSRRRSGHRRQTRSALAMAVTATTGASMRSSNTSVSTTSRAAIRKADQPVIHAIARTHPYRALSGTIGWPSLTARHHAHAPRNAGAARVHPARSRNSVDSSLNEMSGNQPAATVVRRIDLSLTEERTGHRYAGARDEQQQPAHPGAVAQRRSSSPRRSRDRPQRARNRAAARP